MKKVLLSVVAMMIASMSFAQNTVVASLSHGTDVTMFYGSNALIDAVAKAESGDMINLSGGTFYASNITKAITLRGAGIDSENATYILNNFTIEIPADDANRFTMEGIRCQNTMYTKGTFANPHFVKCQFNAIQNATEQDAVTNQLFVNCKIIDHIYVGANNSVNFVSSYVTNIGKYQNGLITSMNSIHNQRGLGDLKQSQWYNCIFFCTGYSESYLPADAVVMNCIYPEYNGNNYAYDIFRGLISHPGTAVFKYDETFKTFDGKYTDEQTFELTDAAKAAYLGTDGKEVGLYGGPMPFNLNLSYPLISKMEVGEQTDDKGQLEVTIEVSK
ncbi:MAG: hypothetical protein IJV17_01910 [Prevotella sp.]|nr:hypothetical protein [Prevotella sp.]